MIISNMKHKEYENRPSQMTYNNLQPPELVANTPLKLVKLLGLGLYNIL